MDISALIAQIPEHTDDEALLAVQAVTLFPATNSARLRCHLSHEFRVIVQMRGEEVTITADGWPVVTSTPRTFLANLKRTIHEIDAAIAEGSYRQARPKENIILNPPCPPGRHGHPGVGR